MTDIQTPTWTLGDRLRKARTSVDVTNQDMADILGVERNTVSRWEHDQTVPTRAILLAYAMRTGVPVWWLEGKDGPTSTIWYRALAQVTELDAAS